MLPIPGTHDYLYPGDIIQLGRFSARQWVVEFGWYAFGGNREVCGWYLTSDAGKTVKPIQKPDLDDIIVIQRGRRKHG